MSAIPLSPWDLALAACLVLLLGLVSLRLGLGVGGSLLRGALRTCVQLLLVGLVLEFLFAANRPLWMALMAAVMLLVAGREVRARQSRPFRGAGGFALGTLSMFVSSFTVALFALTLLIRPQPWFEARYAIPLLGMLLGNTMNGVGISLDRLGKGAADQRTMIEGRLLLGASGREAIAPLRREALRAGLIPLLNALAAAGVVSLPGMMTGQILAGAPPLEAVRYQILIMFLITAGAGFGSMVAVVVGSRRLFDGRDRLRLERLAPERGA